MLTKLEISELKHGDQVLTTDHNYLDDQFKNKQFTFLGLKSANSAWVDCTHVQGRGIPNTLPDGSVGSKISISVDYLLVVEEKEMIEKEMTEDLNLFQTMKDSGMSLGSAIQHGAAVGAATEGVDFTYSLMCNWLHSQFDIPMKKLQDPVNREVITAVSTVLLHFGAGAVKGHLPVVSKKIQSGCELVADGKARDNFAKLVKLAGPVLVHVANLMDPEKAMERLGEKMKMELEEQGFNGVAARVQPIVLQDELEEEEAEAEQLQAVTTR